MTLTVRARSASLCALLLCAALLAPTSSQATSEPVETHGPITVAKYTSCALGIAGAMTPLSMGSALLNCARLMAEALN